MNYKYKRVYLTEKDSQVEALSVVVGAKKNGKVAYTDDKKIALVPLQGHVIINKEPKFYAEKYDRFSEFGLNKFPNELILRPNPNTLSKYKQAIEHLKDAEEIVIAADNDNEGATLALNVIKEAGALDRVLFMMPMGSTHPDELRKNIAKNSSDIPYMSMYEAGKARAWVDFIEGMYLSRALSYYLGNNYAVKINYGGVKAPLTYIVVERDLAFESHKVSYYWTATGRASLDGKDFDFKVQRKTLNDKGTSVWTEQFDSEDDLNKAIEDIKKSVIKIQTVSDKKQSVNPPKLYELTALQADMSKKFKVKPDIAMELAQKNYDFPVSIQGYPRTDIPYLKEAEYKDVPVILNKLGALNIVPEKIIKNILSQEVIPKRSSTFNDKEVVAHGAIIPTLEGNYDKWLSQLPPLNKGMFELIAKRYISNFMGTYDYQSIVVTTTPINDIRLHMSESVPLNAGWKEIDTPKLVEDIKSSKRTLPVFKKDDVISIVSTTNKRNETSPKPLFTMETLLLAMGKVANLFPDDKTIKTYLGENGIGTPATRSTILSDIMNPDKNNGEPLLIEKNGKIMSTEKARNYIKSIPDEMTSPIKRALLSKELKRLERGEISYKDISDQYREELKQNIETIKRITDEKGPLVGEPTESLGKCPLCGKGDIIEKPKLYMCSAAQVRKLEDGTFVNNGCDYKIFKSGLSKLGKKTVNKTDVKKMLSKGFVMVSLVSSKTNKSYEGKMISDPKWGIKIDFS